MNKTPLRLYLFLIVPMLLAIVALVLSGNSLSPSDIPAIVKNETAGGVHFEERIHNPLTILLAQIIIVITLAKIIGFLFSYIGQPPVVGEITAGLLLGPSFLGKVAPQAMAFFFPESSMVPLQLLSQTGLLLFMFVIGLEVDLDVFKKKASGALIIGHVSIGFPFLLGVALAWFIYSQYAPSNVTFSSYALFMGIALSITAFPVLARILKDRNLNHTPLGSLTLLSAAVNDVSGWFILAIVVTIARAGNVSAAFVSMVWSVNYLVVMLFVVKPFLKKLSEQRFVDGKSDITLSGIVFLTMVISSFAAEIVGIHALFGAFLAGVIMPSTTTIRHIFIGKLEDVSVTLLLPLFFAFTGLRTDLGLLFNQSLLGISALIVCIAVIGKVGGSAFAAFIVKQDKYDSLRIGILMNTRGLMELIILNIGYDLGILTKPMFTALVLMTFVTTLMTGPLLKLIDKLNIKRSQLNKL